MLSRTAEHLFWMTRHTGRAENLARVLEAQHQLSLIQPLHANDDTALERHARERAARGWLAILASAGVVDRYHLAHKGVTSAEVIAFMVADPSHPASIVSCLRAARENARTVRGWAAEELWETINTTWLDLQRLIADGLQAHDPSAFFEWVRARSNLARGVQLAAPVQDEGLDFLRLGAAIEGADHILRTLEAHGDVLAAVAFDYHRAYALLRAVSGVEAYRRIYRDTLSSAQIASLLIQCPDWHGSLAARLDEVRRLSVRLRNSQSAQTERLAQLLCDEVRQAPVDEWLSSGRLSGWFAAMIVRVNDLARRVGRDLTRPLVPGPVAAAA
ncbi:alpha-E domain-containing protein [Paraburkholderia sp. MMS20-SJTN17]|uniref:Alpha-E domain-containing protein n=1 Tax=Paraburkholderia translucens TaxID=2886945 RepID=A0ABS8KKE1_9BURK|nr:alpha-E domain-containing protein [Paraburkholderia sp. MMS20-SJTN17]MCC8405240.1 alpha-E domain-containing protein [Paraburkholderia sp. MMS20-SJTN17]